MTSLIWKEFLTVNTFVTSIAWKSKDGKSVTSYSNELEYYTTIEIANEVTVAMNCWRKFEFKLNSQSSLNVIVLDPSILQIITETVNIPTIWTLADTLFATELKMTFSTLPLHRLWTR
jgi:hypothetical protein